jgi:hypothetical protein
VHCSWLSAVWLRSHATYLLDLACWDVNSVVSTMLRTEEVRSVLLLWSTSEAYVPALIPALRRGILYLLTEESTFRTQSEATHSAAF